MKSEFLDIKIGDICTVFDEYSREGNAHTLRIDRVEQEEAYMSETTPKGIVYYGTDLDEDKWGDDYITVMHEGNFCKIVKRNECPEGGDASEDCSGCIYGEDYHLVDGDCLLISFDPTEAKFEAPKEVHK